jgi:hypothetical protein
VIEVSAMRDVRFGLSLFPTGRRALAIVLCAAASWAATAGSASVVATFAQQERVNPDAKLIAEFNARVKEYVELHKKLESTLPPLPKDATTEQILGHQRAMERMITTARDSARQGDIFPQHIRAHFRRQLARALAGPDGRKLRDTIMDEIPQNVRIQINGRYPDALPLSNVPARVLLVLPKLPEELEYRFVGDRLILFDSHAYIVVDYIDKALPR